MTNFFKNEPPLNYIFTANKRIEINSLRTDAITTEYNLVEPVEVLVELGEIGEIQIDKIYQSLQDYKNHR